MTPLPSAAGNIRSVQEYDHPRPFGAVFQPSALSAGSLALSRPVHVMLTFPAASTSPPPFPHAPSLLRTSRAAVRKAPGHRGRTPGYSDFRLLTVSSTWFRLVQLLPFIAYYDGSDSRQPSPRLTGISQFICRYAFPTFRSPTTMVACMSFSGIHHSTLTMFLDFASSGPDQCQHSAESGLPSNAEPPVRLQLLPTPTSR